MILQFKRWVGFKQVKNSPISLYIFVALFMSYVTECRSNYVEMYDVLMCGCIIELWYLRVSSIFFSFCMTDTL